MVFLLFFVSAVCVSSVFGNTRGQCRLDPHPSVEYRCIVPGGFEGFRACRAMEPAGTLVSPQCRRPNFYSQSPLAFMKCFNGYWDYIARCTPECGRVTPDGKVLVIGGKRVKRGELPWHAGIYSKATSPYMQICGGSLISDNVVLSAAHCFWDDQNKQQPASQFAVAVGKLYRPWDDTHDEAQKSNVKVIHLPPRYQGAIANFQDDIAVVIVAQMFQFRGHIRPVCLSFDYHFEKQQLYTGNNGKVAGWGLTAVNGNASTILQVVDLPYVEVGTCIKKSPPNFGEYITSDKVCAGTLESDTALCKGDSGGGLAFPESILSIERYYLRGVVSTAANSENACNTDTYTSFTSITAHEHFIKQFWSESGQFRCQDDSFITVANYCDGTKECADGSDETLWACAANVCSSYLFQCEYGACVDRGAICNGVQDCADGSDEAEGLCNKPGSTRHSVTTQSRINETSISEFNANSSPCQPSPCGFNAICKVIRGFGTCMCEADYSGDPYVACEPECVMDSHCSESKACIQNKCKNPCYGACTSNALCQVVKHTPLCSCAMGYTGDPFNKCTLEISECQPSLCGPNTRCVQGNRGTECACLENYIGTPPECTKKCESHADCLLEEACYKNVEKCVNPCLTPDICGVNAKCVVNNHNPICQCPPLYTGDPFFMCSSTM